MKRVLTALMPVLLLASAHLAQAQSTAQKAIPPDSCSNATSKPLDAGYFGTGVSINGNNFIYLRDLYVNGTCTQSGSNGYFKVEQYSLNLPSGFQRITDYGWYPVDPPTVFMPVVLRSSPAGDSYITMDNVSSNSVPITVYQYYTGTLISTQTFTLPANVTAYKFYLTNIQKTCTSRADFIGHCACFPPDSPDRGTYYINIMAN